MDLREDLLVGVAKIAAFRGESKRRVNHLLARGLIPGYKRGGRWESRRSTQLKDITDSEKKPA